MNPSCILQYCIDITCKLEVKLVYNTWLRWPKMAYSMRCRLKVLFDMTKAAHKKKAAARREKSRRRFRKRRLNTAVRDGGLAGQHALEVLRSEREASRKRALKSRLRKKGKLAFDMLLMKIKSMPLAIADGAV